MVSLQVTDWKAAKKFYRETLGWPVAFSSDEAGWEEYGLEGAAHGSISRWDEAEPMPTPARSTTLVLTVDDAFKATEKLRAKGG